jgi:hypothetical protein
MSVTVKQISELTLKNKDIELIIKEQLQIIDDKLLHANRSMGKNYVIHTLPYNLPHIPGVTKPDLQRIVYSTILISLEKRGFHTKIILENSSSMLYISWISELDDNSVAVMNSIIKQKRISQQELQELLRTNNL